MKNCELPCEGITTPGGFGNAVKSELSLAVSQAVADVYPKVDLPHYFKYVQTGDKSTEPKLEHLHDVDSDDPKLTVNVPAGTGDWFGGWQGDGLVEADRYLTVDGTSGRMAELIDRKEPAVMLCHWPGMYCNGKLTGYYAFQRIVRTLKEVHGDRTIWMKLSEIGRYFAAKKLTKIEPMENVVTLRAPFSASDFTFAIESKSIGQIRFERRNEQLKLRRVESKVDLKPGTVFVQQGKAVCCVDLPKGLSKITNG